MAVDPKDAYVGEFATFESEISGGDPAWLRAARKDAIAKFAAKGFPTLKTEAWKYTNVSTLARTAYHPAYREGGDGVTAEMLAAAEYRGLKGAQLVFVNGRFEPRLSRTAGLPEGTRAEGLAKVLAEDPAVLEPHLGRHAKPEDNPFTALNTAFWTDGALVSVPPGVVVEDPIHLLFASVPRAEPLAAYPRNLILLGEQSQATVIETYAALGAGTYLTNAATEIAVGPAAVLEHIKVQREADRAYHVGLTQVEQDRASAVRDTSISMGGALARNDANTAFVAEGGALDLDGLYMTAGTQHVDNHTRIDHLKPACTSRENYKGILDGRSRGVFYGNIIVHPDAQKTNAMQTNRNLLLSNDALVDSTPGLQILANDVKCRHASTIGHLQPEHVFYLQSRGFDESTARSLLTYAFAGEVVRTIRVPAVRAAVDDWVLSRLPNADRVREAL